MTATQQDYSREIVGKIPAHDAYQRLTQVQDWWTKSFKGRAEKVGDKFGVRWGETFVDFEVIEAIPDQRMTWLVSNCDLPWLKDRHEWTNTQVAWELSSQGDGTSVRITHRGLKPEVECYEQCQEGWDFYVGQSLLRLLNEGKGSPDREGA